MAEYRLRHLFTHIIAGAVGAGIVLGAQSLMQPSMTDGGTDTEDEFGTSVRDYLQDNPEVVVNAIKKFQSNEEQKQIQAGKQFVKDNKAAFFNNAASPVVGNPDGDATVVEFFDYNCHYCKNVAPEVAKLMADDSKLRMIHKHLPILGPESIEATKVALAANMQSQTTYAAINKAFWAHEGRLSKADIEKIAKASGAKWEQILVDKESDAVKNEIKANYELAQKMGLTGTPGFVVGEQILPGAQTFEQLKSAVSESRTASTANAAPAESAAPEPALPAAAKTTEPTAEPTDLSKSAASPTPAPAAQTIDPTSPETPTDKKATKN